MFLSSLFHSDISDGKKRVFEKVVTNAKMLNDSTVSSVIVTV